MTPDEANKVLEEMQSLWPAWEPTEGQHAWWHRTFLKFDYSTGKKAVEAAYGEKGRARDPEPKVIRDNLRSFAVVTDEIRTERATIYATQFWVQCVVATKAFPGRLGHFVQLVYPASCNLPLEHVQLDAATRMAAKHEALYGGEWRVVRDATWLDLAQLRQKLLRREEAQLAGEQLDIPF